MNAFEVTVNELLQRVLPCLDSSLVEQELQEVIQLGRNHVFASMRQRSTPRSLVQKAGHRRLHDDIGDDCSILQV